MVTLQMLESYSTTCLARLVFVSVLVACRIGGSCEWGGGHVIRKNAVTMVILCWWYMHLVQVVIHRLQWQSGQVMAEFEVGERGITKQ